MARMPHRLSIIGPGLRVDGHLVGDGDVEIHGHLEGSVHIGGELRVLEGGIVRADVLASRVIVEGQLHGTVRATHEVRVAPTGALHGRVEGPLHVEDGGVYRGRMTPGRVRPSKTVNTRRRPAPPPVSPADRRTQGDMPAVPAPVPATTSLGGSGEFAPTTSPDEGWYADAPRPRPTPVAITDGEPPPMSVSSMPSITEDQVALRLESQHLPDLQALPDAGPVTGEMPPRQAQSDEVPTVDPPDPTELPKGPTRLAIPNPPRRRTTAPGVAPFRTSFGAGLPAAAPPAPAPPAPRPANVSGRAIPAISITADPVPAPKRRLERPVSQPGVSPDEDPDLSDSWFLGDDEELKYP